MQMIEEQHRKWNTKLNASHCHIKVILHSLGDLKVVHHVANAYGCEALTPKEIASLISNQLNKPQTQIQTKTRTVDRFLLHTKNEPQRWRLHFPPSAFGIYSMYIHVSSYTADLTKRRPSASWLQLFCLL